MTEQERAVESERAPVDGREVLEKLAALPVSSWGYEWEPPEVRHLGPMAQDFLATFGLGDDERRINLVDANGVLIVAVQALYRRLVSLEAEVVELRAMADSPADHPPPTEIRG